MQLPCPIHAQYGINFLPTSSHYQAKCGLKIEHCLYLYLEVLCIIHLLYLVDLRLSEDEFFFCFSSLFEKVTQLLAMNP